MQRAGVVRRLEIRSCGGLKPRCLHDSAMMGATPAWAFPL
jgi:hypothetical protein